MNSFKIYKNMFWKVRREISARKFLPGSLNKKCTVKSHRGFPLEQSSRFPPHFYFCCQKITPAAEDGCKRVIYLSCIPHRACTFWCRERVLAFLSFEPEIRNGGQKFRNLLADPLRIPACYFSFHFSRYAEKNFDLFFWSWVTWSGFPCLLTYAGLIRNYFPSILSPSM